MSKYTTEVRFICEQKAGITESGASNVDNVISNSWEKIFTSKVPFFDESYRSVICQKILKAYYLREICAETVGVWMLWLNQRLEEIMPYYNQMYETAKLKIDPFNDVNITRNKNGTIDSGEETTGNNNTAGSNNTVGSSTIKNNGTNRDLYSDTPQGAITGLENENYLTNARKVTDTNESTSNINNDETYSSKNDYTENKNIKTTEGYIETIIGKQGTRSYSSLLMEYRNTFLNLDKLVIGEFEDLFFGLW